MVGLITYALAGQSFSPEVVFPALALFSLLRQPLMFLPRALSATADAKNALARLQSIYHAHLMEDTGLPIYTSLVNALEVDHATFEWEQTVEDDIRYDPKHKHLIPGRGPLKAARGYRKGEKRDNTGTQTPLEPFSVKDLNMVIPRGRLHIIVGPVGAGKTSVLSGLLGEMKITMGRVRFGGKVGYCSQIAWIQNATVVRVFPKRSLTWTADRSL